MTLVAPRVPAERSPRHDEQIDWRFLLADDAARPRGRGRPVDPDGAHGARPPTPRWSSTSTAADGSARPRRARRPRHGHGAAGGQPAWPRPARSASSSSSGAAAAPRAPAARRGRPPGDHLVAPPLDRRHPVPRGPRPADRGRHRAAHRRRPRPAHARSSPGWPGGPTSTAGRDDVASSPCARPGSDRQPRRRTRRRAGHPPLRRLPGRHRRHHDDRRPLPRAGGQGGPRTRATTPSWSTRPSCSPASARTAAALPIAPGEPPPGPPSAAAPSWSRTPPRASPSTAGPCAATPTAPCAAGLDWLDRVPEAPADARCADRRPRRRCCSPRCTGSTAWPWADPDEGTDLVGRTADALAPAARGHAAQPVRARRLQPPEPVPPGRRRAAGHRLGAGPPARACRCTTCPSSSATWPRASTGPATPRAWPPPTGGRSAPDGWADAAP